MNIIDKYGIKEVADVTIYELNEFGEPMNPVLFLDTLKICEIEVQKEQTKHYGGTAHSLIVNWDYISGINIRIEDALFSMKSLAVLCGGRLTEDEEQILKTETFRATGEEVPTEIKSHTEWKKISGWNNVFTARDGSSYFKLYPKFYNSDGEEVELFNIGELYYCTYYLNSYAISIEISHDTFPGYYCLIGKTYARSFINSNDEEFYFVVPKAKLLLNLTLNLGNDDASVFDFNFVAVKNRNFDLLELIQIDNNIKEEYDLADLDFAILNRLKLNKTNWLLKEQINSN